MSWPLSQDYNEAIQSPRGSFKDPDLQGAEAVTNALGLPIPRSGNFADVYELRSAAGGRWAVKCFTREVPGLRERYAAISGHLAQAQFPFIVDFTFLQEGIRVGGRWYPILKMQWVEGLTLNELVRQHADRPAMLKNLLHIWVRMAARLREAGMAHADLQHGNVLLVPGSTATSLAVKLVDYDGMFVPALAGTHSGEIGHPCYQHPQRLAERTYSLEVDRFPLLLIATALECLRIGGRALWERYDSGDNLLFRESDLQAPVKSPLFAELLKLTDEPAARLVRHTLESLRGRLEAAPLLQDVLPEMHLAAPATSAAKSKRTTAVKGAQAPITQLRSQVAEPAGAVSETAWDFQGKEEYPPSRRRRREQKRRPVVLVGGVSVVALMLLVGFLVLLFRGETEKPKDKTRVAQHQQKPAKSRTPAQTAAEEEEPAEKPQEKDSSGGVTDSSPPEKPADPPASWPTDPAEEEGFKTSYLSSLKYLGKRHSQNSFSTNGTIFGIKFKVAGRESPHALFLPPPARGFSEISYKLGRRYTTLRAGVAVPRLGDAEEAKGLCLGGSLFFEVIGDKKVLWKSRPVSDFDSPQWCSVNIDRVDVLLLRVHCPGIDWCARSVWLEPRVSERSPSPSAPKETPVVSQPPEPRSPASEPMSTAPEPGPSVSEGFVSLFNGEDLKGWKTHPSQPGNWRVVKGTPGNVLTGSGPGTSHLYSERDDYRDFHLFAEVRISKGGNSGVLFRSRFGPKIPLNDPALPKGYEAQINSTHSDIHKTGSLYVDADNLVSIREAPVPPETWFTLEVIAQGPHFVVKVNGQTTADFSDPRRRYDSGHIVLQQWGSETEVEFRKVLVKRFDPEPTSAPPTPTTPADPTEVALKAYEKACENARAKLLANFETVLGQLAQTKDSDETKEQWMEIVKEEKERFESKGLVPWSYRMRPHLDSYLASLDMAQIKLRRRYEGLISAALRARNEGKATLLQAELTDRLAIRVLARWQYFVNGRRAAVQVLYSNWTINNTTGSATWTYSKGILVFRFPAAGAPGGAWVDTLQISSTGKKIAGTNNAPRNPPTLTGDYVKGG